MNKKTKRVKTIKTQYTKEQLKAMIDDEAYKVGYAKGYHAALSLIKKGSYYDEDLDVFNVSNWRLTGILDKMTKRIKKIGF